MKEVGKKVDGLYILLSHHDSNGRNLSLSVHSSKKNGTEDIILWHKRLGNVSSTVLHKVFPSSLQQIRSHLDRCTVCPCAKQTRLPFTTSSIQSKAYLYFIHVGIWGPYKIATFDGNKFFLTIVDDYSRFTWVFLLEQKSDVCVCLQYFLTYIKNQFEKCIKTIRTDNGTVSQLSV